jgi:hypothetical protein
MSGNSANLMSGPAIIYIDESGDVDFGFTKGPLKLDVTAQVLNLMADQLGTTPANKIITGIEAKVTIPLAEYTLVNIKRSFANAVPLQDDVTSPRRTRRSSSARRKVASLAAKKITIKPIDPITAIETTNKDLWITIPLASPDETTIGLELGTESQRVINATFYCFPDTANSNRVLYFGDGTAVDANESGF